LTSDHTRVAEMLYKGEITKEQAKHHPHRNRVRRSIGLRPNVEPDVQAFVLEPQDSLVLCSDGLWNMVEDNIIGEVVSSEAEPFDVCRDLVDKALAHGGRDNITVVFVDVKS